MNKTKSNATPDYEVVKGFNYGKDDARVEAGQLLPVTVPADVIAALLEMGALQPVQKTQPEKES
jgi:hypothetical protein